MSWRFLLSDREGLVVLQNIECNANLKQFLFVGLLLKVVFILLVVKGQGLLDACGKLYPKIVDILSNTSVDG